MMKALSSDQHDTVPAWTVEALEQRDLAEVDDLAAADMQEEYNAWMLETREAGSPHIGARG